tara:strand:- start:89 stop:301 length:213 start_codon:yes stop_codon:yes gene_type:complete
MTLNEYRIEKGWSYSHLARQIGCSHATVARRWCLSPEEPAFMFPGKKYMSLIKIVTNGMVQPNDFYKHNE